MSKEIRARDIMCATYDCLMPEATLRDAAHVLQVAEERDAEVMPGVQALMVVNPDGTLAGVVSMFDILKAVTPAFMQESERLANMAWEGLFDESVMQNADIKVEDVMARDVITVEEDALLPTIMQIMVTKHIRRIPVMKEEKVVGLVRLPDVFAEVARKFIELKEPRVERPALLLCTDGNKPAQEAAHFASHLAHKLGADMVALRVVDRERYAGEWDEIGQKLADELEEHAGHALEQVEEEAEREAVGIRVEVRHGDASAEIIRFTRDNPEIRMVVMGATGRRGGLGEQIFGSTAERVLVEVDRHVPCPVLLTPTTMVQPDARIEEPKGVGRILVCVDGSEPAREATEYAVGLASSTGSELVILRVVDVEAYAGKWDQVQETVARELEEHAQKILSEAAETAQKGGVKAETVVEYGDSSTEIAHYAREHKDVIMVVLGGSGRRRLIKRSLGSTAERVARHVGRDIPCPVLVTPSRSILPQARMEI